MILWKLMAMLNVKSYMNGSKFGREIDDILIFVAIDDIL
jgi:hypothetical protein